MVDIVQGLIDSVLEAPELFVDIALNDPGAAIMLGIGGLLMFGALGYLAFLVAGMAVELLTPASVGRQHPRGR